MTQKRIKFKLKWQSEKRDHVGEFTHGPARFPRLARSKEDCIEVQFSASEVIPCNRRAKHSTTSPPSEGRVTPLCGLYWDVPLDRIRFLVPVGYGQYR